MRSVYLRYSAKRIQFASVQVHDCCLRSMHRLLWYSYSGKLLQYVTCNNCDGYCKTVSPFCPDWRKRITSKRIYIKKMKILGENANLFNVTVVIYVRRVYMESVVAYISYLYLVTRCIYVFARLHAYFIVRETHIHILVSPLRCIISIRLIMNAPSGDSNLFFHALYLAPIVLLLPRFQPSCIPSFSFYSYRQCLNTARMHEFGRLVLLERSGIRETANVAPPDR